MAAKVSFEQLCAGKTGYAFDESAMVKLTTGETYNELVFKIVTKCETNLIFLPSPTCALSQFTLDVIPNYTKTTVASIWKDCEKEGFDGLSVIVSLDASNVPESSLATYSFPQFVNSLIHSIESHFMFQKYTPTFTLNTLRLWKAQNDAGMKNCCLIMAWKFQRKSLEDVLSRSPLSQLNSSPRGMASDSAILHSVDGKSKATAVTEKTPNRRQKIPASDEISTPVASSKKRRVSSVQPPPTDDSTDEDTEISFRKHPDQIIPKVTYIKGMEPKEDLTPAKSDTHSVNTEPIGVEDVTLGFEKPQAKKGGRKSTARKSLVPDWPEEEKEDILNFFDNLNPSKSEQTRVALTCKFAQMQHSRELPSKLLYQWIQKKGRPINKRIAQFEIPESEQNKAMLDLYKELNPENSETSRVAFICKFVNMQFGISLTSKEFYDLLNGKGKKAAKRR